MVYGLIRSVQAAVKYRGGWKGLFEHMYTVSSKYKEFVILIGPSTFYSTIEMKWIDVNVIRQKPSFMCAKY